jgi:[CysO sulfur-carrier protein]-thiocarboxylate-dependent cysteine synthase
MIAHGIKHLVGNTPLLEIKCKELPGVNLFVKLESFNPTGSIKDRACIYLIDAAIENRELVKTKTILDASSGNMACALAYFGAVMGYNVKVICNSKLTADKKKFIEYFDAEIEIVGDLTIEGNLACKKLASSLEGKEQYCFLDQLHNPANPQASHETLGPEIYLDLPNVVAVAGSMGSGGSMLGVTKYLREKSKNIKVFTSQAASGTKIPGTGAFIDGDYVSPFVMELQKLHDATFFIEQTRAEERTAELAKLGVFAGLQAGGVLEALIQGVKEYSLEGDVVMIIGDAGWKNMEKLATIL